MPWDEFQMKNKPECAQKQDAFCHYTHLWITTGVAQFCILEAFSSSLAQKSHWDFQLKCAERTHPKRADTPSCRDARTHQKTQITQELSAASFSIQVPQYFRLRLFWKKAVWKGKSGGRNQKKKKKNHEEKMWDAIFSSLNFHHHYQIDQN